MKKLYLMSLLTILIFMPFEPTQAHVFIADTSGAKGAVLHINPDDDPVTGKSAKIYLDVQKSTLGAETSAKLIINGGNNYDELIGKIDGSLVVFTYTFPTKGVYNLRFVIGSGSQEYIFEYSQRVSRGADVGTTTDQPKHQWAEFMLISSAVGLVVLGIIIFNRRHSITQQSTVRD